MEQGEFSGSVVVVTGGTAGNGRAIAKCFAQAGASVAVIARGSERLKETEDKLRELGAHAYSYSADVADAASLERAAEAIEKHLGPIDIWINNAMTAVFAEIKDTTAEEFERVTAVTYLGQVNGTLVALRRMRKRNRGHIIQIGSALAYRGIPLQATYSAAKHAVKGFQDSLRAELLHEESNITTTMVQLPAHNTPQFEWTRAKVGQQPQPVPPVFSPFVAAEMVLYAARYKPIEVLGGWPVWKAVFASCLLPPAFIDWYLARAGYSGQLTDESIRDRPGNLYEPVEGVAGARGRYTRGSKVHPQLFWLVTHRHYFIAVVTLGALGVLVWVLFEVW